MKPASPVKATLNKPQRRAVIPPLRGRVSGFSLIDVVLVIVLMGIVSVVVLSTSSRLAAQSAQGLRTRQMMALAQGLLNEVRSMPFTYCDAPTTATSAAACGAQVDTLGPEPGETRYNAANRFDGVSDYNGFAMPGGICAGLCDVNGTLLNGPGSPLQGCTANVTLAPQAFAAVAPYAAIAALDASGRPQTLRIVARVVCAAEVVVAEGIRVRHAPNRF